MNTYNFDDIKLNMKECFSVKITEEMQDSFRFISGDINPMHDNSEYAIQKGFNDKLVYGMLTSSFFSTLVGVYLPGKNCLFQECKNIKFRNPVYIGDELNICGEVIEIDERFKRITIKATIRNQEDKKVCTANLIVGVLN